MEKRKPLQSNKKGISELVSYVLLIAIALGLSVLVYQYIKTYVPKDSPECQEDIHLRIKEYTCKGDKIFLTYTNTGLFNIDAAYVRITKEGEKIIKQINDNANLYFSTGTSKLAPQKDTLPIKYDGNEDFSGDYILEVQPAILDEKGNLVACNKAITTKKITCPSP